MGGGGTLKVLFYGPFYTAEYIMETIANSAQLHF